MAERRWEDGRKERKERVVICSSFFASNERTDERAPSYNIYKSSLDRPDGCIITIIIVERESETRVEPFRSSTSREIVNRVTSAHFTRTITCPSPDYHLFSTFLRRHSVPSFPISLPPPVFLLHASSRDRRLNRDSIWRDV